MIREVEIIKLEPGRFLEAKAIILKTKSLNKYGLIILSVNVIMLPAIGLYKKYGFEIKKTEKNHIKKEGKSFDIYNMELILA